MHLLAKFCSFFSGVGCVCEIRLQCVAQLVVDQVGVSSGMSACNQRCIGAPFRCSLPGEKASVSLSYLQSNRSGASCVNRGLALKFPGVATHLPLLQSNTIVLRLFSAEAIVYGLMVNLTSLSLCMILYKP